MPDRITAAPSLLVRLQRVFNSAGVRLLLSVAIIFSLIPEPWVKRYEPALLVLFALEFCARLAFAVRRECDEGGRGRGWRWPRPWALVLLLLDLLALISFLPIDSRASPWMRILRLLRFAVLFGYWAPLMRDLRIVMVRRERSRQVVVMGLIVALLSFAGALVLQQSEFAADGVDYDEDGHIDPDDSRFFTKLWWAFRQIQDPGNLMAAPSATAVVFVSLGLTVAGIFLVSFLIGLGTDVVREMMELSQLRPPGLHNHTVIVNITAATRQLLEELMRYYQKVFPRDLRPFSLAWFAALRGPRYVVVGVSPERPEFLRRSDLAWIVYRHGSAVDESFMHRADIAFAQRVVLLADSAAAEPDAETIRASLAIVEGLRDHNADEPAIDPIPRADVHPQASMSAAAHPASLGHLTHQRGRGKLLIAEILDERSVPAAWAALASGRGELRAFIVVVDRMIAIFLACVGRSAGIAPLLTELLTCAGHDIYTCFFDLPDPLSAGDTAPRLPSDPPAAMEVLTRRARALPRHHALIPIALLYEEHDALGIPDLGVAVGGLPPDGHDESAPCSGFVALAPSFACVRRFSDTLRGPEPETCPEGQTEDPPDLPAFAVEPHLPLRRILICGFRPATIALCEALVLAEPDADILVLVAGDDERRMAVDRIDVHHDMVERRLLRRYHGAFVRVPGEEMVYRYQPNTGGPPHGRLRIAVGDTTSPLQFVKLPAGFGHVANLDLVYILSSP
ncbi:MAG TPA: hypothetical protein VIK91_08775, partial [Nannocystis sp.]